MFVTAGARSYVAGIASGGHPSCRPGTSAFDMEVYKFRRWISRTLSRLRRHVFAQPVPIAPALPLKACYCHLCRSAAFDFIVPHFEADTALVSPGGQLQSSRQWHSPHDDGGNAQGCCRRKPAAAFLCESAANSTAGVCEQYVSAQDRIHVKIEATEDQNCQVTVSLIE